MTAPVGSHGDAAALQQMGFDHLIHHFGAIGYVSGSSTLTRSSSYPS